MDKKTTKTNETPWKQSALGKKSCYKSQYDPSLLFPIERKTKRLEIGIDDTPPFSGMDILNAYELSWLNPSGKPHVAIGEIIIPCESAYLIESKSLKLYLNSLNDTPFSSRKEIQNLIQQDLSTACQAEVEVNVLSVDHQSNILPITNWQCLDQLDITIDSYTVSPSILQTLDTKDTFRVYSHLLKSNCLVTGQPDWGTLFIEYRGPMIDPASLLKYIISFRHHNEFHEQCIERVFMDILMQCKPEWLTVFARYTRRGGIDINPYRSNTQHAPTNTRLARQ